MYTQTPTVSLTRAFTECPETHTWARDTMPQPAQDRCDIHLTPVTRRCTSCGHPALDELLSSRAPLPFVHCPEKLPAAASNGSCNPLSTADEAVVRGNVAKFEAAKASIDAGDVGLLAETLH